MITNCSYTNTGLETEWNLRGLSTDSKPNGSDVPNGSTFLEMDTGAVYVFDKANTQWRAL